MTISLSTSTKNDRANALNNALGPSTIIKLYSGSRPANANVAATGTLLATITCNGSQFGTVSNGVLTASPIAIGTASVAGVVGYARFFTASGSIVADVDAGTSGTSLILNTTLLVVGSPITVNSIVFTEAV